MLSGLSEYSADQRALHTYYKANSTQYDASRSVVFLFNNQVEAASGSINEATKLGDMPINRRWGYLFGGAPDARTLAHELGHGRLTCSSGYVVSSNSPTPPALRDIS